MKRFYRVALEKSINLTNQIQRSKIVLERGRIFLQEFDQKYTNRTVWNGEIVLFYD